MLERLQKIIARAGITSRRNAEKLILAGQVTLNGQIVTELGTKADAERDSIKVGGKLLRFTQEKTYLILYKPPGCVSTMSDPEGRKTIRDFLQGVPGRVFPVGRLDYHTSGLLLLTNDGALANRLLQAAERLPQTYWLKVKGRLSEEEQRAAERGTGVKLRPVGLAPAARRARGRGVSSPWYEATLSDARRDILRRCLEQMGHPVEKLKRVQLANLALAALPPGRYRYLTGEEVRALERLAARNANLPRAAANASESASRSEQRRGKRRISCETSG